MSTTKLQPDLFPDKSNKKDIQQGTSSLEQVWILVFDSLANILENPTNIPISLLKNKSIDDIRLFLIHKENLIGRSENTFFAVIDTVKELENILKYEVRNDPLFIPRSFAGTEFQSDDLENAVQTLETLWVNEELINTLKSNIKYMRDHWEDLDHIL